MTIDDIPAVHRLLKREYDKRNAPVIEFIHAQTGSPFKVLIATILSARTRDETTTQVVRKLFDVIHTPDDLRRIPLTQLESLLHPVGFFRVKARHLKALPDVLDRDCNGRLPDTIEGLCKLPGVGRKTANLVLSVAFDKDAICVDVHVHRITNRLGLIQTQTPFETEMQLRNILPRRYWKSWNRQLVSFGQTCCKPRRPHCPRCPLDPYCDHVGVFTSNR